MKEPASLADLLLQQLNIKGKPNLVEIVNKIGLRIHEVDSSGFEGALVRGRNAQKGVIAIKAAIHENTRKRFTIAHEIGHYVIPNHQQLENVCTSNEVESWRKGLSAAEAEANEFAAELLMPTRLISNRFDTIEPSFQNIIEVAREFDTSLTATTRRFIEVTGLSCAMVWSQKANACWCARSDSFPFYLPLEELPSRDSKTGRLFRGQDVPIELTKVPTVLWLRDRDANEVDLIFEQTIFMKHYEAILTLLWVPYPHNSDATPLLEDLDPTDFTLNRRKWPKR